MATKILERNSLIEVFDHIRKDYHSFYYSMYSSVFDGIVTDGSVMVIPIDDHMVHRGDAVFETVKCINGGIYNLDAHLSRLMHAAEFLCLERSFTVEFIKEKVIDTVKAANRQDCLIRIFLSRGCGNFGVNPVDSLRPELYIVCSVLKPPFMHLHPEGARAVLIETDSRPPIYRRYKTCCYIWNVMMQYYAYVNKADFAIGLYRGLLTEGAAENIAVVTRQGELLFPRSDLIVMGTTLERVINMAEALIGKELSAVKSCQISVPYIENAEEILVVGTTPNVTSVTTLNSKVVGNGKPGRIGRLLDKMLEDDILTNRDLRIEVFR